MKIFDYVVFYVPKEGNKIVDPTEGPIIVIEGRLIESDQQIAQMKVTRLIPSKYDDVLQDLTIAIRPF